MDIEKKIFSKLVYAALDQLLPFVNVIGCILEHNRRIKANAKANFMGVYK